MVNLGGYVMNKIFRITIVSIISGIMLIAVLCLFKFLHTSRAYDLLFNFEYIPIVGAYNDNALLGILFHFGTCIVSTIVLYYIVKAFHVELSLLSYILPITIGSAVLYFLSAFTTEAPSPFDLISWGMWVLAHLIYSVMIAYGMKFWVLDNKNGSE